MGERNTPKVLLLGLDAADPALLLRWAEEGRLPALASLLPRSRVARMDDLPGLWTGAVWPSLVTGVTPTRHGYYHYHDYDPRTYATAPFKERGYEVETFWQRLSEAGRRVAVLDVPLAPLARSLNGLQLVDWAVHEPEGPTATTPEPLAADLIARFGDDRVGQCDYEGHGPSDFAAFTAGLCERVRTRAELTRHVVDLEDWDLLVSVFSEPHCVGHQCWHLHDPAHPLHEAELAASIGDPVLAVYREVDRAVGQLIDRAGSGARVFLVASHGMGASFAMHFLLDRVLQRIEGARAPGSRLFNGLYRTWRRIPASWRSVLRPVGARARRQLAVGARRDRKSFELNTHCGYGALRINLEGREPNGTVSRDDFEETCREIGERLRELVDPASGAKVVERVLVTSDHYERTPEDVLPDLIVEWERDLPAREVYSEAIGRVRAGTQAENPNRSGDHRPSGSLFLGTGAGIEPGEYRVGSTVVDVAPTVLEALGVGWDDLDGRPLV